MVASSSYALPLLSFLRAMVDAVAAMYEADFVFYVLSVIDYSP